MFGDDAEADVAGAQSAGLTGILVRTGKYSPEAGGAPDLLLIDSPRVLVSSQEMK